MASSLLHPPSSRVLRSSANREPGDQIMRENRALPNRKRQYSALESAGLHLVPAVASD